MYRHLPFAPEEDREKIHQLLLEEGADHDMVLYTDHRSVRLLGIFPEETDTAYFAYWEACDPAANRLAFECFEQEVVGERSTVFRGR